MKLRGVTRRHPITCAVGLFLALALGLTATSGTYLTLRPDVGGWTGGNPPRYPVLEHHEHADDIPIVLTERGAEFGFENQSPLGAVSFSVQVEPLGGWPRSVREHWTVQIKSVTPSAGAPSATDLQAWRALLAQALCEGSGRHEPIFAHIPAAALRGEAEFTTWRPRNFVVNPSLRLWHAPLWLITPLLLATAVTVPLAIRWYRRRARPGHCERCGYNLSGLITTKCPECGSQTALS